MKITCFITPLVLLIFLQSLAGAEVPEYQLKALYMERFTRFVEWPEESDITDTTKPFVFGVIGESPFRSSIDEIYASLKIKNKRIVVQYISHLAEIDACHLLFISGNTRQELVEIMDYTKDKPVLTVSDTKGYAHKGVHINFYIEDGRLRFEINQSAVNQSSLEMSYMLMQHARILNPTKGHQ